MTFEESDEFQAKITIKYGIDKWIDGGGDIAKPDEPVDCIRMDRTSFANHLQQIHDAEWKPSDDEDHEHHAENFHGFLFVTHG